MTRRLIPPLLVLALVLAAVGCKTTQKRYDRAQDLEAQGRYAEAADYYIQVLRRDDAWVDAAERLRATGDLAVADFFDDARAAADEGRYEDAVALLDEMDDLADDAAGVGVMLAVPENAVASRREWTDRAVEGLVRRGEAAEARGDWSDALDAYTDAAAYPISIDLLDDLDRRRAVIHVRWGEQEADAGRYRAAFGRAQDALELLGPDDPLAGRARDLQFAVLQAGTRFVAFLPFWRTDAVEREAPDLLVDDLNDVLLFDHWSATVPFLASAEPVDIRRELRRLRYDRTVITSAQAAEIGRIAEADFVVVGEVKSYTRSESNVRNRNRTARIKGRGSTVTGPVEATYREQTFTLRLRTEVVYRIVESRTRRVVDQGSVSSSVSGSASRGVYDGDYQDLDLDGEALSLFEDSEHLAEEDLLNDLVDDMADRLAGRIYDRLMRQIP